MKTPTIILTSIYTKNLTEKLVTKKDLVFNQKFNHVQFQTIELIERINIFDPQEKHIRQKRGILNMVAKASKRMLGTLESDDKKRIDIINKQQCNRRR